MNTGKAFLAQLMDFLSMDDLHAPRQSLRGRPLRQVADLCRTIARYGICATDVLRESARYRGLPRR